MRRAHFLAEVSERAEEGPDAAPTQDSRRPAVEEGETCVVA